MAQSETKSEFWGEDSAGLSTRQIALHMLDQVLLKRKALDHVLAGEQDYAALADRDRNFVRMLVSTILRRKGQMDDLIARALDKKQDIRPETLRLILYIGTAQILFMDVADHAAVDTSVRLAETQSMEKQKGFINAILRRMTTEGREWVKTQNDARLNIPAWLYDQWEADYGADEATSIAKASLAEASLDITIKDFRQADALAQKLEAATLPTGSLRRTSGGNVTKLSGFGESVWWVQDAAAAIPARLFGDLKGKTVVDLCAAPGGKTAQLAAAGAHVIAVDRSAKRMATLKQNMERLHLQDIVETVISDGASWRPQGPVDHILLDAPCSATGTIRRHPDVMHLKEPIDQQRLSNIQARLFENAADMIKPGGVLIYCTCSLQKDEGERQVDAFLRSRPDFRRAPITAGAVGGIEDPVTENGDLRILPHHMATHGGLDGFYVARLVKS